MKKIFFMILLISFKGFAQNKSCELSAMENMTESMPNYNPEKFRHKVDFDGAPINSVGSIHDAYGNILCTGYYNGSYGITDGSCANTINSNLGYYYFTVFNQNTNQTYSSKITKAAYQDSIGAFDLEKTMPSDGNLIRANSKVSDYYGQEGWILVGHLSENSKTSKSFSYPCKIVSFSQTVRRYNFQCEEDLNLLPGAILMGRLCGEWAIIGIQDSTSDQVDVFSSENFTSLARKIGYDCRFVTAETCKKVSNQQPDVWIPAPNFEMRTKDRKDWDVDYLKLR
jgi:hypothetical protein